jgi:hypothetical protein
MIAVGVLVTKMAVAVGYVATEGGAPEPTPHDFASEVRFTVTPAENGVGTMEIELPNGELFELTGIEESTGSGSSAPAGGMRPGRRSTQRTTTARPDLIASLASTLGRSMRCDVEFGEDEIGGSADCAVVEGESYRFVF